jgi:hypothetical protein
MKSRTDSRGAGGNALVRHPGRERELMPEASPYSASVPANTDKISNAATPFMVAIHDDALLIKNSGVPSGI